MQRTTNKLQARSASAPEPQPKGGTITTTIFRIHEFRSDEWAVSYTKRIDATIAALKSAGVPVFWVGLPSIRGPKSTSDVQYLNDLYRARAEKAGVSYIDVWDGFVDESGRFTAQGPDFEGQIRRLRPATACISPRPARASLRTISSAKSGACWLPVRSRSRCRRASRRRRPSPPGPAVQPLVRSPVRWCR